MSRKPDTWGIAFASVVIVSPIVVAAIAFSRMFRSCLRALDNAVAYYTDTVGVCVREDSEAVFYVILGRVEGGWTWEDPVIMREGEGYRVDELREAGIVNRSDDVGGHHFGFGPIDRGYWPGGTTRYMIDGASIYLRENEVIGFDRIGSDKSVGSSRISFFLGGVDFSRCTLDEVKKFAGDEMTKEPYLSEY